MAGYWYLASPYTSYPRGLAMAERRASEETGLLIKAGVNVISPIAHSHNVAAWSGLDMHDHDTWLRLDAALIDVAHGMIWLALPGASKSRGMQWELERFRGKGKPVIIMEPGIVPAALVD